MPELSTFKCPDCKRVFKYPRDELTWRSTDGISPDPLIEYVKHYGAAHTPTPMLVEEDRYANLQYLPGTLN